MLAANLAIINGSLPQLPSFSSKVCRGVGGGAPFRVKLVAPLEITKNSFSFRGHITEFGRRTKQFDD